MWEKANVVFKLKSPLHIGYIPFKGSVVSPTRYYVPGRSLWGAITKRVTEYLCENPGADDYKKIGMQVMESFRFSYFYLYDGRRIYLPHYTDEGLMYGDKKEEITRQEFEHRFIGSLVSTAISDEGTAKGGSLHEIEFINNKFRDGDGKLGDVRIAGCIWIKRNTSIEGKSVVVNDEGVVIGKFNAIQELILGGESKYGFGHVLLDSINRIQFPVNEKMEKDKITLDVKEEEALIAHLRYDKSIRFKGDIELLTGRGYFDPENSKAASNRPGRIIPQPQFYFSPGTVLTEDSTLVVNWDGTMEADSKETN